MQKTDVNTISVKSFLEKGVVLIICAIVVWGQCPEKSRVAIPEQAKRPSARQAWVPSWASRLFGFDCYDAWGAGLGFWQGDRERALLEVGMRLFGLDLRGQHDLAFE